MDVTLKTTSFGGYDKKAVENYIDELTAEHEKEVADLKANVLKLSETVKNLHTMREVNLNESSSTIENLKKVNDELQVEVTQLRDPAGVRLLCRRLWLGLGEVAAVGDGGHGRVCRGPVRGPCGLFGV